MSESREIKFRAWHLLMECYICNHEWLHYGPPIVDGELSTGMHDIEQFTGLEDKNGVDIYECDILEVVTHRFGDGDYSEEDKPTVNHTVSYNVFGGFDFGVRIDRHRRNIDTIEVIGNIHENPELLVPVAL